MANCAETSSCIECLSYTRIAWLFRLATAYVCIVARRKRNRKKKSSGASADASAVSVDLGAEAVEGQNAEGQNAEAAANAEENLKFDEFFDDGLLDGCCISL